MKKSRFWNIFDLKRSSFEIAKKVFVSFVPKRLIQKISEDEPLEYSRVQKLAGWHLKKLRFGDIRELHASILTKYLTQPEIDFLHGRVGVNVFMSNYFNVNVIDDLRERMFSATNYIQNQIA